VREDGLRPSELVAGGPGPLGGPGVECSVGTSALQPGTTLVQDGFRRVCSPTDPGQLIRARALLLELGIPIPVPSWEALATLCDTGWLAAGASERIARRRLRLLSSAPTPFARAAAAIGSGAPIHLRGTCRRLGPLRAGEPLWRVQELRDAGDQRWTVEEGSDFLLVGPEGGYAHVLAEGGHLVFPAALSGGEEVSVFGFADETADRSGLARSPNGRGGRMLALRTGAELPLLVTGVVR
jgi:hypothetical protein